MRFTPFMIGVAYVLALGWPAQGQQARSAPAHVALFGRDPVLTRNWSQGIGSSLTARPASELPSQTSRAGTGRPADAAPFPLREWVTFGAVVAALAWAVSRWRAVKCPRCGSRRFRAIRQIKADSWIGTRMVDDEARDSDGRLLVRATRFVPATKERWEATYSCLACGTVWNEVREFTRH